VAGLRASLPYTLTGAQERVWDEIRRDMAAPHPMHRLLQGDVGSGKTVVAALAVLTAIEAGYQAAVMAPTEILAEQHLLTLQRLLVPLGIAIQLLTSGIKGRERAERLASVAAGDVHCVVGTHALVQEGVEFRRLGLAVVDEQHRFGVAQRARLRDKGEHPDLLVMTATPIPRTLALTLYGDLDLSLLDEMPPGRQRVKTHARKESARAGVYRFLRDQIAAGVRAGLRAVTMNSANADEWGEVAKALADPGKDDRQPELVGDRHRHAALGGPIQLGQHNPGHAGIGAEGRRLREPVLTGRGVEHQQDVPRLPRLTPLDHAPHLGQLGHQLRLAL